jgi:hypothetical protein
VPAEKSIFGVSRIGDRLLKAAGGSIEKGDGSIGRESRAIVDVPVAIVGPAVRGASDWCV